MPIGSQADRLPAAIERFLTKQDRAGRALCERLASLGMSETFWRYLADANEEVLETFFSELARVDFDWLERHRSSLDASSTIAVGKRPIQMVPLEPAVVIEKEKEELREAGWRSLVGGEWAEVVFAGGAGTRFQTGAGQSLPKGLHPLTPVMEISFLELFIRETLAAGIMCGRLPVVVLLTSSSTGAGISLWLDKSGLQGFPKEAIWELRQAEHPRLDEDGNLIVDKYGHIIVTGDGHGGVFKALLGAPADRLRRQGVRSLVLHNVDNAAAHPFDPVRLGFHRKQGFKMTLTAVERVGNEKVGLIGRDPKTGRVMVVEYSACPEEVRTAKDSVGKPLFWLAHINTNLVELDAIRADLPATLYTDKRIIVSGRELTTSSLEMLNQSLAEMLPAETVGVLLVSRSDFFLPTKSLAGEDSLLQTRAALSRAALVRLRSNWAAVDDTAIIELDPCAGELDCRGWQIGGGARLAVAVRHGEGSKPVIGAGLRLEPGATLILETELPYGKVRYDPLTRAIGEDVASAGRISVGEGVRVRSGSFVRLCVEPGESIVVSDGEVL
ncbi:MAG: UTP--glucose-1-phosphate uridylyltransferase [candidate division WOR-3 bacterium]